MREVSVTLEELAQTLPNGFHDAEVKAIAIDYVGRRVVFDVSVWVGDMEAKAAPREGYRDGEVVIEGLRFIVVEPPDPRYPFGREAPVRVSGCERVSASEMPVVSAVPVGCFVSRFFVVDWNSFIYVAGVGAELTWASDAYDRGPERG